MFDLCKCIDFFLSCLCFLFLWIKLSKCMLLESTIILTYLLGIGIFIRTMITNFLEICCIMSFINFTVMDPKSGITHFGKLQIDSAESHYHWKSSNFQPSHQFTTNILLTEQELQLPSAKYRILINTRHKTV